jgi:hypothetical protein
MDRCVGSFRSSDIRFIAHTTACAFQPRLHAKRLFMANVVVAIRNSGRIAFFSVCCSHTLPHRWTYLLGIA